MQIAGRARDNLVLPAVVSTEKSTAVAFHVIG
jgi:hypothetical protein